MGEYRLEMLNIAKSFPGVRVLEDVSLKVKKGSIHALMGENGAGKSTLMKILFGVYQMDGGRIKLDGEEVQIDSPRRALDLGISMIHQELHPIPYRSVMENIWLGRFPKNGIVVDEKEMRARTEKLLEEVDLKVSPSALVGGLSVSNVQELEIAKAISYHSKIIIMDEPTSSLTESEVEKLFALMRKQRDKGTSIIYISHKMEEIREIADEVSVMRDGHLVATKPTSEITTDEIIRLMVGRDITNRYPPREHTPSEELVLEVNGLSGPAFRDVSFQLRRGEILGIGGLVGAGRTELVESLFGVRPITAGEIKINGKPTKIKAVKDAKKAGLALLTEERRATGIIPPLSVMENTVLANEQAYATLGILKEADRKRDAEQSRERLRVKTASLQTPIRDLSGGNQQKVLIARWLLTEPEILILDEPTRGIDVGAKYEIYTIMMELVKMGKSVIMISSEMPELLGMSDRVLVMCEGQLAGTLEAKSATQVDVMRLATKFM